VGDDHPLAAHVAVLAAEPTEARSARAGPVVAVGSLFPEEPPPWLAEEARVATMPDTHAGTARWWRIRGMATAEGHRGQGLGGVVLDQLLSVVADQGGLVWCNARVPAVPFYLRAGFLAAGEVFELPLIGAHQAMWRGVAAGWDTDLSTQVSGDPHHSQGAVHA
jgi:GNAT superfamily N-acetyltransferase